MHGFSGISGTHTAKHNLSRAGRAGDPGVRGACLAAVARRKQPTSPMVGRSLPREGYVRREGAALAAQSDIWRSWGGTR